MPITIGSLSNVPAPGDPIRSPWAQDVTNLAVHHFASVAALKAAWPVPPDGAVAWIVDESAFCIGKAGTWRYYSRTIASATGNTAYLTWAAAAVAATSASSLVIQGRSMSLYVLANLTTPGTTSSGTLATLAAGYRPAVRHDYPVIGSTSTGGAAARGFVDAAGVVSHQLSGAPASVAAILLSAVFVVADLVAA
jgi:hypothetical protein